MGERPYTSSPNIESGGIGESTAYGRVVSSISGGTGGTAAAESLPEAARRVHLVNVIVGHTNVADHPSAASSSSAPAVSSGAVCRSGQWT
jgi:hypothetical protein